MMTKIKIKMMRLWTLLTSIVRRHHHRKKPTSTGNINVNVKTRCPSCYPTNSVKALKAEL